MSSALDQLKRRAQQWDVAIESTGETNGSVLAFGVRRQTRVVLKISKQSGDEWHAGETLRAFDGDGMVRVYESDAGAVLLEQLHPGTELVELVRQGKDETATEILAQVMLQMAHHAPPSHCPTVLDWARGFDRYLKTGDKQVPSHLVSHAGELYRRLATSAGSTMLLHGDLHHYNVLFDSSRGWVAIDPKGVVGELEYEVGAILRNPVEQPEFLASTAIIERRLRVFTDVLHLNYRRALEWSFAQAVLSAIWDVEDGYQVAANNPALRLAHAIRPLLD
ncbi:MAG TPA: aminoglycoside phosphotransferase family protein [Pyrinomonadaceae bacterium]|nr:aminoglycoside phosphotransferase family protein [Pyrinomonadaceae bacterium]